jgi:DNA polymerase-1
MGVSFAWRNAGGEVDALYCPFRHRFGPNYDWGRFRETIQQILDSKPTIFHNAKFDLVSLETLGLRTREVKFFDTMLIGHQINENVYNQGLDSAAKHYLDDPGKRLKGTPLEVLTKKGLWEIVPAGMMVEYAAYDAHLTLRLFEKLWPMVVSEGTVANWRHRASMVNLVADMERNGVLIDVALCQKMAELGKQEMDSLSSALGGLNPASPIDLRYLLHDTLKLKPIYHPKTGNITFNNKAMEEYEIILSHQSLPIAQQILAYRGWQKSTSSNYEPYVELLSPDGKLRPNYKLHGTVSGRFSCERPNLQQIPRSGSKPWNGRMKACFIPEDGWVLVEADYAQLEARLGAVYADEKKLIEIFNDPSRDIFSEMASALGFTRDQTKTMVYSIAYGAGVNRIATVFNVSLSEARKMIDNYFSTYPGLKRASDMYKFAAMAHKKVKVWSGRYRHFQYSDEHRKAFNSIIQGGAADIVERTMLRAAAVGLNNGIDSRMVLQVHDSIVFEVRKDMLPDIAPVIKQVMSAVEPDFGVRFAASLHYWGSKTEVEY